MTRRFLFALCVVMLGSNPSSIVAEQQNEAEESVKKQQPRQTKLRKLIDESVDWYQLLPSADSTDAMEPITIFRWPNNARKTAGGATVVWVANGRPEAVAAIYLWQGKLFSLEFDSLSRGKIVAKQNGNLVWQPMEAGLEFRAILNAREPARSTAVRQRQMKMLAAQFQVTLLGWKPDDSQREELRMLPRSLYRYRIKNPDKVFDGALFAYVSGTDPEAIRVKSGRQWQYAFVRRPSGALEGRFRNKVVWTAKRYPPKNKPRSVHIVFSRDLKSVLPAEK